MASVTTILAQIDTMVSNLLADSASVTTYRIGGKSVNKTEALLALGSMREKYDKINKETPYEDIRHVAFDYDEFGREVSERIGDEL